ncbi:hypothetical protein [Gemmatimonas sp.]|uniref:hypothetical protein n=1 Tax=Gemmatimonas sp. TaxID=1962908 RepID=UPI00333EFA14
MTGVHASWFICKTALRDRMLLYVLPAAALLPLLGNTPAAWCAFGIVAYIVALQSTSPSLFERALPVGTWALFAGKIGARALLVLLPVAAWVAVTRWRIPSEFTSTSAIVMLTLGITIVVLPFAAEGFSLDRSARRPQAERVSGALTQASRRIVFLFMSLIFGLTLARVALSEQAFAWVTSVLAAMSCVAAWLVWPASVTAPKALAVEREAIARAIPFAQPDDKPPFVSAARVDSVLPVTSTLAVPLKRAQRGADRLSLRALLALLYPSTSTRRMTVFIAAIVMMQGVMRGDFSTWIFFTVISPTTLVSGTAMLATLPFSPRRRLWAITIAGPLMLVLSYGLGFALPAPYGESLSENSPRVKEPGRWYHNATEVRLTFWTWSRDGTVPTITAPWGEVVEPFTVHVLGQTFYNAYTVKRASSARFVDWQLERLTTVAYGTSVTADDLKNENTPPLVTRRWPVLLVCSGLLIALALFTSCGAWMGRGAKGLSFRTLWIWLMYLPLFLSVALSIGTDVGGNPLGSFVLKGILAYLEVLPPQPLQYVGGVLFLALAPVALMAMLLDRVSRYPQPEFAPVVR